MNKGDLIEAVAAQLGESKTVASKAVEAVLASIVQGVERDERVAITGFGTFRRKTRKGRTSVNPATKQPMVIRAQATVGFTPSQQLRTELAEPGVSRG